MESRVTIPPPLWFVWAILPMVASQIVRLQQSDPAAWIFWDYAGRLSALAVLGVIPSARRIAFGRERLRMAHWEIGIWIAGIVLVDHYLCGWMRRTLNSALPSTVLGHYPEPHGWCITSILYLAWRWWRTAKKSCSGAARESCSKKTYDPG
jgi:uncharacterized protein